MTRDTKQMSPMSAHVHAAIIEAGRTVDGVAEELGLVTTTFRARFNKQTPFRSTDAKSLALAKRVTDLLGLEWSRFLDDAKRAERVAESRGQDVTIDPEQVHSLLDTIADCEKPLQRRVNARATLERLLAIA